MGLTMTDEQEFGIRAVLDRVPDHVNANSKRLLAELDATRAKLADAEDLRAKAAAANSQRGAELERMAKRLAEAEHELAHMRSVSPALLVTAYKQQAKRLAEVERERDEAAADAREAAAHIGRLMLSKAASQAECARLREVCERAWHEGFNYAGGVHVGEGPSIELACKEHVARILGERAKEDGDA